MPHPHPLLLVLPCLLSSALLPPLHPAVISSVSSNPGLSPRHRQTLVSLLEELAEVNKELEDRQEVGWRERWQQGRRLALRWLKKHKKRGPKGAQLRSQLISSSPIESQP